MWRLPAGLRTTWLLGLALTAFIVFLANITWTPDPGPVSARPLAQAAATPTCEPISCDWQRVNGYQPYRDEIRAVFNAAAVNDLGSAGPVYIPIAYGLPPVQWVNVSPDRPIPHTVLRGMGWQESRWKQFADDKDVDPDDGYFCTLREEGGRCGCGLMQMTWCMTNPDECSWLDRGRTAGDLTYNLGAGTNWLISRWNDSAIPFLGSNDHTRPQEWYFGVTNYNGWSELNDPNGSAFDSNRPPYGEGNYITFTYPYQEVIWGWMAHPEVATNQTPDLGDHALWRPTRIPWVARGMWGLGGGWEPPLFTPRPLFHLVRDIQVVGGTSPTHIWLHNLTSDSLAAEVVFYTDAHTYTKRWNPSSLVLAPHSSVDLPVENAFPGRDFDGYACITTLAGVAVTLGPLPPTPANAVFLPAVFKSHSGHCYNAVTNGGLACFPHLHNQIES
jgi:hypothetical protein